MKEDGLKFPSFSELFTNISLEEVRRFQTWIYNPNGFAYDGGTKKYTVTLWWDDNTFTKLDYHRKLEGSIIVTIYSHDIINKLERNIRDSTIEALNNTDYIDSDAALLHFSVSPIMILPFLLIRIFLVRKRNRLSGHHKL